MVNGPVGAALRVFPGSHRWASTAPRVHRETAACFYAELVWIPPYTLFLMRGDCYHAGAAWAGSKNLNDAHGIKLELEGKEDLQIQLASCSLTQLLDMSRCTSDEQRTIQARRRRLAVSRPPYAYIPDACAIDFAIT